MTIQQNTEALLASFGFDHVPDLSEPALRTSKRHQHKGWEAKPRTLHSPKWALPLWKTMKVYEEYDDRTQSKPRMLSKPPRWDELTSLAEVGVWDRSDEENPGWRSTPEFKRYLAGYTWTAQRAVRKNLRIFCRRYFDIELMPFHLELLEMCFTGGRYVCMLPTEHGKSTLLCVVFPLLGLMENPDDAYTICANNLAEAKNRLRAVKAHLEGNVALLRDFPWIGREYEGKRSTTWGATELIVGGRRDMTKLSPSLYACGRGDKSIKGRRAKTIHDDLEGRSSRERPEERRELREWFMTEAIRTIETDGDEDRPLIMVAGTPYSVDSFYFFLATKPGWKVYRRPYKYADGGLIWPIRAPKVREFRESFTRLEFAIAMTLDPTGGDADILSEADIRRLSAKTTPMPLSAGLMVTLDPAGGAGRDYAGIAVVRWHWPVEDPLPHFSVRHPRRFEKGIIEQVRECQQLANKYALHGSPAPVLYEVNGRQKQDYASLFHHFAPEIKLVRWWTSEGTKLDKTHGFTVLKTMLREGRLSILSDGSDADEDGCRQLYTEIRDLGTSRDDHIVAALWFVFMHAYGQRRHTRGLPQENVYDQDRVRARMAARTPTRSGRGLYFGGTPAFGGTVRRFAG